MKLFIMSTGIAREGDLQTMEDLPEFRRATLNMRYAFLAASAALKALPHNFDRDELALVVGTAFGELQSTCDFLLGLEIESVARPLNAVE